ncbi:MAG: hypothetical protein Q7Q73_16780 [Verrucomicrobiota bacterium JB024]|nr:hypothetical protein [Verrucomicrobiota bacterium JB024]
MRLLTLLLFSYIASVQLAATASSDSFRPVNLRSAVNMGFADDVANDHRGGWTDQGPANDMRRISIGIQTWDGIPFEIIDPAANFQNPGASCIVLRGKPLPWLPLETPAIPVNAKASAIYIVGACAWDAAVDEDVIRLVVTYQEDLRYSESAFVFGRHLAGWWSPRDLSLGDVVAEHFNGAASVGLYRFGWINPYPEKTIADIKFISADSTAIPIIVAATLLLPGDASSEARVQELAQRQEAAVATDTTSKAYIDLDSGAPALRSIPASFVSVGNGSSTAPNYQAPSQVLLEAGHDDRSDVDVGLPPRPFYRIQTHMAEPSPAAGVWNFTQLDRIIGAARSFGAEPMICLSFPPSWFFKPASTYAEATRLRKPYDTDAYAEHCAEIVRHYTTGPWEKQPVLWWEFGNEVELHDWSYAFYIKVYQAVANRMREVDPRIRIGGPVTAGPNPGWAGELLRALPDEVDFVSYHQYGYSEPFDTPDTYIMARTAHFGDIARRYRALTEELSPEYHLPIFLTETNTSWRYHEGTDPRIRTQFGAAWAASVLGHFLSAGGDSLFYFTLNGGFGTMWVEKGKTVIYPVWHTLWLYRQYMRGQLIAVSSDADTVEAVAARQDDGSLTLMLVNKNAHSVDITLSLTPSESPEALLQPSALILNDATYPTVRDVDTVDSIVPTLDTVPLAWDAPTGPDTPNILTFSMQPYEVRAVLLRPEN